MNEIILILKAFAVSTIGLVRGDSKNNSLYNFTLTDKLQNITP